MVSFADLKRSSKTDFEKLTQELNKLNAGADRSDDDRFWQPTVDKAGNGYAVIRFLPAPPNEDLPFIRLWNHGFQGPGGWYIENSLTTIGLPDPAGELNSSLWNSGVESDKDIARKQKRKLTYISNIYVVKDPGNPDNEGKTFLYKYGKKIFDKLNDMMNPQFEDEAPVNPFDFWQGCNFKLKIRQVEGYRNYDKSEFDSPSPLSNDDEEMENIWNKEYSLQEFLDKKNFKTYEELQRRLNKVLGIDGGASTQKASRAASIADDEEEAPAPTFKAKEAVAAPSVDDDDSDMDFFKKLAEED